MGEKHDAPGRIRTDTEPGLSRLPLLLGYAGDEWLNGAPDRTFAYNLRVRSAVLYTLSYGSVNKWCARAVLPRLPPQCQCGDLLLIYRRVNAARSARR